MASKSAPRRTRDAAPSPRAQAHGRLLLRLMRPLLVVVAAAAGFEAYAAQQFTARALDAARSVSRGLVRDINRLTSLLETTSPV
jgi:hypothetical protein